MFFDRQLNIMGLPDVTVLSATSSKSRFTGQLASHFACKDVVSGPDAGADESAIVQVCIAAHAHKLHDDC